MLPNAINVFNLLVMKAFFESLPTELEEAAAVDGLSTYGILLRIVLPLSKAIIATMVLFYAVVVLELLVHRVPLPGPARTCSRSPSTCATSSPGATGGAVGRRRRRRRASQAAANIQAVTIVLTILPILRVYPFVQRYFVSGVMLGAVKG